ncbi:DUF2852 domain-containing protein [Roseobacter sp. YSTF-M11]|uniref:DUF2852 domain-containing protein n=1 Tax=Roseobacter insulae TaxID=2859783 RepID=A0A9X1FVU9_9RHOB|nr:DUF2852 domain-containing protein [Roseobacter insulae]MBW4708714.1 DUF2852 domain-containing protein [Roseobacter insulae]
MTTVTQTTPLTSRPGWFSRAEHWLDSKGKGAWIAAMVLGFVFFWPVGLALLFYMIWSKRMFTSCSRKTTSMRHGMSAMRPSGNSAFDAYKSDTLRRLEDEQQQFEAFLDRLRDAKDKAEFDQFMNERADKSDKSADQA